MIDLQKTHEHPLLHEQFKLANAWNLVDEKRAIELLEIERQESHPGQQYNFDSLFDLFACAERVR
jgi:hypothetical protein